ncbi:MAG: ATP-binding protein [Solirubrobacteraceae bacterium]|nr:ATP-binding protein [Solirubrobacteraceae bacterium]
MAEAPDLDLQAVEARIQAAVRGVAASDPDPTDPFRGLYISDDLALQLAAEPPGLDATAGGRLDEAAERLGLTALERAALAVVAAPHLDPRYARLFAYLHDDVTRKLPSPRLVARLIAGDRAEVPNVLACFAHDRPLRRLGAVTLVTGDDVPPLADRGIRLADRLAAHLVGAELDDPAGGHWRTAPAARTAGDTSGQIAANGASQGAAGKSSANGSTAQDTQSPSERAVAELSRLLRAGASVPLILAGTDAPDLAARAAGAPLLLGDARRLADDAAMAEARLRCRLEGRVLVLDGLDELVPEHRAGVIRGIARHGEPVILLARTTAAASTALGDLTTLVIDAPEATFAERCAAWQSGSGVDDARDVSAKFRLSLRQIDEAIAVAQTAARARGGEAPTAEDLDLGARQASSSLLGELAQHVEPRHRWDDLVLPERQLDHLRSIAAHLRHRDRVLQEWGYEDTITRGHGLKALFAGESGTGKTMAAQVIARELGLDLYRVDLATVVSKYIGETEKNLDRIFTAAEGSNAIIFFDEADALFGKRSEVGDAHDRYANIEVSYLLQKMEGYEGCVVLATNFQRNIDDAFLRRLDYVVDFPFPDEDDRKRIWQLLLPERAPIADDVDLAFLAERFKLAGGAIRNAALAAGYLGASEGDEISMRHLVRAVGLEYAKLGRLTIEADFEHYHEALR